MIYQDGKRAASIPVCQLDRIVVAPHITLSSGVLGLVAAHNVALLVLNHRHPERCAGLSGAMPGDVRRRVAQVGLLNDGAFRLGWSRRLVALKITRQYQVLARALVKRPELRYGINRALVALRAALASVNQTDKTQSLASLRGVEGAAAAAYFQAFTLLFPDSLQFAHRNRRPPTDPVNACLSLSYTLFHQEAVNALKAVGLDPAVGCYHELYYGRESLACDLLEPVRPLIDAWLWQLFRERRLRPEDFVMKQAACSLNRAGKQRFYEAYHGKVGAIRLLLRRYARVAVNAVNGQGDE